MKVAYDLLKQVVDIDYAVKSNQYHCIHCGCEMIPSALDSYKVSPYFRAKNSHVEDCAVKMIDTKTRYNNKESELEEVYEKTIKDSIKKNESTPSGEKSTERKRKENSFVKVRYLNQLVSFCLGNDINESLGSRQIKDFFVDKRTYNEFHDFKEGEIYLFGVRFKKFITEFQTMYFTYPIGAPIDEIGMYFFDLDTYYQIKDKIFNKDEEDRYKDIYVIGEMSPKGKIRVFNEGQFFFIPIKDREIKGDENE